MRALALLALCLPSTVLAGNPYDKYMGSIGEVQIDGVVEVPLRLGLTGDNMPYIEVKASEDDENYWLFVLDLGGDEVILSSSFAEQVGAEVKTVNKKFFASLGKKKDEAVYKLGGKIKVTSLDELHLGEGLVAYDVDARVGTMPVAAPVIGPHAASGVAGIIGIGALGLPAAILPSEGVVRIAPADQGQAILDAVGGTVLPYESFDSDIVKTWSGKYLLQPRYMVVDGEIAGQPARVQLRTADTVSRIRRSIELGEVPTQPIADANMVHVGVTLGDLALEPSWLMQSDTAPEAVAHQGDVVAELGNTILDWYDMAVDPASQQVALRKATAQQREWSIDGYIAAKARELEPEEEDAEAEAEEKSEDDVKAEQKERAGILDKKAVFHLLAGQAEPAIADIEEAVGLDAEPCERWMLMSEAYAYAHRFDDAAVAAQKAVDRYLAWSSLSMEEREEIEEMDDEEREASGVQPQNLDACFASPSQVAYYQLVAGENAQAIATFDERADLDPRIGVVAGVAYLLEGDTAAAQGPLRHTLNLAARSLPGGQEIINPARIALAELYRQEGDLDTAIEHWLSASTWLAADPFSAEQYADLIRERDGADAVVPALQAVADNMPHNPVIHTVLGNELAAAGKADEAAKAHEYAMAEMDRLLEINPFVADRQATKAWMLIHAEQWASAKEAAKKALELNPSSAYGHWAMMKVAEVERKMPMALKHYRLAKGHQMGHWFFATLDKPELKITLQAFKITETAVEIPEKVYFQTGSAVIDQRSDRLLTVLAQLLNEHPELLKVSIEGHTDSVGKDRDNKKLSQERSEAVMAYLIDKGVDAARLAAKGWGEEKPIASNETDEGKASNRRVEFVIVERAEAEK